MPAFILHPLFGRAIEVALPKAEEKGQGTVPVSGLKSANSCVPISSLPDDAREKLLADMRAQGGRLNDSWDCM